MDPNATANAHFAPRAPAPPFAAATTVSSESLRVFAIGAEARGLDPATVLAASGIDPAILGRRGARVGGPSVADAWTRACERFGDQLFPLTIGDALPMGAIAPLDYLVLSSADIGAALGHVIRYAPILSNTEIL